MRDAFVSLLEQSPLLLLFLVAATGYLLGRARVLGVSLGVAGVLFAGLAFGALDPDLEVPEVVGQLGLVLFVYTVGLSNGPGFFRSLRRRGLAENGVALAVLVLAAVAAAILGRLLGFSGARTAGLFAGALTNTPALAAVLDATASVQGAARAEPTVAYSIAYPFGVVGSIAALALAGRFMPDAPEGAAPKSAPSEEGGAPPEPLTGATVRLRVEGERTARELHRDLGLRVVFSRMKRGAAQSLVDDDTVLRAGDLVHVVGTEKSVDAAVAALGARGEEQLDLDRGALDFRRIFVSQPALTARPLRELDLPHTLGATLTRVRRGDVDLLPDGSTELELGDRVRVVAPRARMQEIARALGDSYRALAEVDVITFSLGVVLGLLLGAVPLPMPTGGHFHLGLAGGPLLVGLVLGRRGRTGPLLWTLPYSANLTLRQLGLLLFLASVGTRSGYSFVTTLRSEGGLLLFAAGACVTALASLATLVIGRKVLRLPLAVLSGLVAGVHTQPATLAFASERARSDGPNLGYTAVFPVATVAKIVLAQLLLQ